MTGAEELLVIEDDLALARALTRLLAKNGFTVRTVNGLDAARRALADRTPDVVLADMALPDGRGVDLAGALAEAAPGAPLIIMTGMPSVDSAVAALRARAFDYLAKPFSEEDLKLVLGRALEVSRLRREVNALRTNYDAERLGLAGASPAVRAIRERIRAAAASPVTILVTGESGVGKERVARAIHAQSGRQGAFVPINCGAVPEPLFEAELFGAKKGAYTGAIADRAGLVAEAAHGTLFLDEIGDMPVALQPKVLRLLQERTYRPLGRDKESKAEVRVVAATNRPLKRMVEERLFREDLYWRLAVVEITIPPLRERPEDIVPLAAHVLTRLAGRMRLAAVPAVSAKAVEALERHAWPGNVRELENVLERALLFRRGDAIEERDLNLVVGEAPENLPPLDDVLKRSVERTEREYLVKALGHATGSVTRAARLSGRNRTAFYRLLEKHALLQGEERGKADAGRTPASRRSR